MKVEQRVKAGGWMKVREKVECWTENGSCRMNESLTVNER